MNVFVTGGSGFIGSAFIRQILAEDRFARVVNFDKLTYAGNLENLIDVECDPRYRFVRGDICDAEAVRTAMGTFGPDIVIHFAAESHVDRSIMSPANVVETNIGGTLILLEAARAFGVERFLHVSTDEVYGSIAGDDEADESAPLRPASPYSASKAGSDLLALSYFATYQFPVMVTRASNNYGPYQFPEKLIPLMITNALEGRPLPVYGDGRQVRDWLHVDDHCAALRAILRDGRPGEIYNIAGNHSTANLEIVKQIIEATGAPLSLVRFVEDRPGHDRRYAISGAKLAAEIGWTPARSFERALPETVNWYREHTAWTHRVKSGEYMAYYARNYDGRTIQKDCAL